MEILVSILIRIVIERERIFSLQYFIYIDRQHVLDCLSRVWMCDGVFVSSIFFINKSAKYVLYFLAVERNQVDEFFTQSSLTQKPVVRYNLECKF